MVLEEATRARMLALPQMLGHALLYVCSQHWIQGWLYMGSSGFRAPWS